MLDNSKKYSFMVKCKTDYIEDTDCYWSAGESYECQTDDFITFEIETNLNTVGLVGKGYLCNDFDEYFETSFRINELPFPSQWLSPELRDSIFREVWAENVKEDVIAHAKDIGVSLSDEDMNAMADDIAYRYVYEGEYDCNCDYWSNLESHINQYPT